MAAAGRRQVDTAVMAVSGVQCAGIMPNLLHAGLGRVWDGALPGLADDWPAVDGQPGVCVLEVAVEHDG